MRKRNVPVISMSIAVIAGIAFFLFPFFKGESPPVKIGYIGSISGKYAAMGVSAKNGALLAAEEINLMGGINGRPVELKIMDDTGTPEGSLKAAQTLLSEGIKVIIGPFTTASATMMLPYINREGILTVGPAIAGENLAGSDDFFIKLFPSTKTIGEKIAALAVRDNLNRMVIVTDLRNKRFGTTMTEGFMPVYEAGGKTFGKTVEFFGSKDVRHGPVAQEAMGAGPEGVFIIASPIDTAILSQKLKGIDPNIRLFTTPWAVAKELIQNGGKHVEGLRFYIPFIAGDRRPKYRAYKERYEKRFGEIPTHVSIFNYEAVQLVGKGLAAAGDTDPVRVKGALLSLGTFEGVQDNFVLNPTGDAKRSLYLHAIKDRQFVHLSDSL